MTDRHATTDELLALRDGEGAAWTRAHLSGCAACAAELFRLEQVRAQLKALPAFMPPRDRFPWIARVASRERRSRWARGAAGVVAAAALTALTFLALRPHADPAMERADLDRAMARSQALEQTLRSLNPDSRALPGDAAEAVVELQDRLSRIDAQLGDPRAWSGAPGRAADLWDQRAGVLGALVDVHVSRVAQAGL